MRYAKASTDIIVAVVYEMTGAPLINHKRKMTLQPDSVRFQFLNDRLNMVNVSGRLILKDGSPGDRTMGIPGLHSWNITDWPNWLTRVYLTALADLGLEDARVS